MTHSQFILLDGGNDYPYACHIEDLLPNFNSTTVRGEVVRVNYETLVNLDRLELHPILREGTGFDQGLWTCMDVHTEVAK